MAPRTCTVCVDPARNEIDAALISGEPVRTIASRYGTVGRMAIQRHGENHLSPTLAKAHEAEEAARADNLLGQAESLQTRTLAVLEAAERTGELRTALSAIREARGNLELLAKLLGELDERPVNVLISPEWLELRTVIVGALEPYSEARGAVLRAIESKSDARA